MEILYICELNYKNKAGLFNATINRISKVQESNKIKVFAFMSRDMMCKKMLKLMMKFQIDDKILDSYEENKVKCTNLIFSYGITDLFLSRIGYNSRLKFYEKELSKYIEMNRVDIIHAHWAYPEGYIAKRLSEKYKIPYVITAHGSDIHTIPNQNKKIKKYTVEALNNANKVFFVSNKLEEQARLLGYTKMNSVISFNGLNEDEIGNPKDIVKTKKIIGYVGNFVDVKGVGYLPDIFSRVKNKKDYEFILIGDGILRNKIEEKLKKIDIKYICTGKLSHKETLEYMSKMDVLVVPSKNEGWGNVVIEAFSQGTYVVGSDAGGLPEAISKKGSVIRQTKSFEDDFAREIESVLNREIDVNEMIEYAKKFTWKTIVEKEIKIYEEILDKKEKKNE